MVDQSAPARGRTRAEQRDHTRGAILAAANGAFAELGYRGTTTREIASRAGISEVTLFRHFESKAELFDVAVLTPVRLFVATQLDSRLSGEGTGTIEDKLTDFLRDLLDLVLDSDHPLLTVMAEVAKPDLEPAAAKTARKLMDRFLVRFEEAVRERWARYGFGTDSAVVTRVILGSVLGVAQNREWLLSGTSERDRMAREMSRLFVYGLAGRSRPSI